MTNLYSTGKVRRTEQEIEDIIKHLVDYEEMAKRALGASWSTLSHRDQHEFVDLCVQLLQDTFVGRITNFPTNKWYSWGSFGRTSLL